MLASLDLACAVLSSALEETAAYAIIAELEPDRVSLFLGICEISTGVGYMIGPPLGGLLFYIGTLLLSLSFSLPYSFTLFLPPFSASLLSLPLSSTLPCPSSAPALLFLHVCILPFVMTSFTQRWPSSSSKGQ